MRHARRRLRERERLGGVRGGERELPRGESVVRVRRERVAARQRVRVLRRRLRRRIKWQQGGDSGAGGLQLRPQRRLRAVEPRPGESDTAQREEAEEPVAQRPRVLVGRKLQVAAQPPLSEAASGGTGLHSQGCAWPLGGQPPCNAVEAEHVVVAKGVEGRAGGRGLQEAYRPAEGGGGALPGRRAAGVEDARSPHMYE